MQPPADAPRHSPAAARRAHPTTPVPVDTAGPAGGADAADAQLEQLARAAAAGDAVALDALLAAIRPQVLRRCRKVLPFPEDAEDACQEALVAVARGIGRFEGRSRFTTWLHPITARTAFAFYRRARGHLATAGTAGAAAALGAPGAGFDPVDPTRVSVLAGARLDVVDALEHLRGTHPTQAEAVILRDLMGMPYEEISELLELPLGTTKSRINTGRRALRQLLAPSAGPAAPPAARA